MARTGSLHALFLVSALCCPEPFPLSAADNAEGATDEDDASRLTVDRIQGSDEFSAQGVSARWLDDGGYATLEPSKDPEGGRDIVRHDPATGEHEVLVRAGALIPPDASRPLAIDDWSLSEDGALCLVYTNSKRVWRRNTRGDYWVLDRSSGDLRQLGGDAPPASLMFAKLSPRGRRVAYVRDRDIWLEDLARGEIRRLTRRESDDVIHGMFDWVYEEEFGLRDGFRWSPDGRAIAYWRVDTSGVRRFPLVDAISSTYPEIREIPWPKVGERNSAVRIGVVEVASGETRWMETPGDARDDYLARMEWAGPDELLIQQLPRRQNENRVLFADARTGKVRTAWVDRDDAWLRACDEIRWLDDGQRFTWTSERDGWRHVWIVSRQGGEPVLATRDDHDVIELVGVDRERGILWYIASPEDPTRRFLWKAALDGSGAERVTPDDGSGWNDYSLSPGGRWAIRERSSAGEPPVTELVELPEHRTVRVLEDNSALRERLEKIARRPVEFLRVGIDDGVELDGWTLEPPEIDRSRLWPVVIWVYGEPAGVTVTDRWGGDRYLWYALLAQRGYVVASFDNRGTPAPRGRAWRKCVYGRIGRLGPADQAAALRAYLADRPWLDPERVAIHGWSGGGSSSLHAVFRYPELYRAAISIAPVPRQRWYDTIYQERYMGLPEDNVEGYLEGSPIHHARGLEGDLLLIHGTGDDNCHWQGSQALIDELVRHDKAFDLMVYPNRSHSIHEGTNTRRHLYRLMLRWLLDHVEPGPGGEAPAEPREDADGDAGDAVASKDEAEDVAGDDRPRRIEHELREVAGWTLRVDRRLLAGPEAELGREALGVIENGLDRIVAVVPAERLEKLRDVPIWLDLDHELGTLQYHPSAGWLRDHGHDPAMERAVHIPRARRLVRLWKQNWQPWVLLHELAHAYHDRVLGFDDPKIRASWERAMEAGLYDEVLHIRGRDTEHYARTNPKEYFAEMTEAYFGTNDFYPFVRAELARHDPETYALLEEVWGALPE